MGRQVPAEEFAEAVAELDAVRATWMSRPEVRGVDVGLARTARGLGDELAIRVYVDPESADPEGSDPLQLPSHLGKFPVDVIETTFGPQQHDTIEDIRDTSG
jgi:hypothetical protein